MNYNSCSFLNLETPLNISQSSPQNDQLLAQSLIDEFELPSGLSYGPPDLTIIVTIDNENKIKKEYKIHKAVVTKWKYFEALLKKGFLEKDAKILQLYLPVPEPKTGGASFAGLLLWMYGRIKEHWFYPSAILDTIRNAGYLALDELVQKCYTVFALIWRDVINQDNWNHKYIEEGHLSEMLNKATQVSLMTISEKLECILRWATDFDADDAETLQRLILLECGQNNTGDDTNIIQKRFYRSSPTTPTALYGIPFITLLHLSALYPNEFDMGITSSTVIRTVKQELNQAMHEWA